ncbi:mechanosensitive ion channel family protein [Brevundimonas sp.]|uniref:mechanosensitive ion channel family protein n=1 Tax=Brevundimonas sp. TaxID=1871086 RepID=UPI0017B4F35F|nr:mechanosensitive ion channel family protein [Brevundimonas sp.]MBA3048970.1 mechanosensitive ion channel family protein [Brevundimonas sp.]
MPAFVTDLSREIFRLWQEFYWLPEWAVITVIVVGFVFIGWAVNQLVFALLKLAVRKRDVFWRGTVGRARLKVRIAVMIAAMALAVTVSPLDPEPSLLIRQTLLFAFILTMGWMLIGASDMWAVVYLRRFNMATEDNLVARKHVPQARILQRVAALLIAIVTLGLALLTISAVRQWGLSLLASAGVVGLIAGLALQPFLTNMIAGIQIATAQPIRLDDAVVVEGEWGTIEEITSTYVVVKLWDWRRLVLPLSYFINKPFQNWTRESARLIGSAFLYVDYEAPMERLRAELERICRASLFWDGDVISLQVVEITERTAQVRCLASARNAPTAFDLRCEIREKMLAFMRDECPEALPRDRVALDRPGEGGILPPS